MGNGSPLEAAELDEPVAVLLAVPLVTLPPGKLPAPYWPRAGTPEMLPSPLPGGVPPGVPCSDHQRDVRDWSRPSIAYR